MTFVVIVGWIVFATSNIIATDINRVKKLFGCIFLFGFWTFIESLVFMFNNTGGTLNVFGGNYIGTGRIIGLMSCIMFIYLVFGNFSKKVKFFLMCILISSVYIMFSTGARGPFISLIFSCMFITLYLLRLKKRSISFGKKINIVIGLIGITATYILYIITTGNLPTTITRLLVIFQQENMGASAGTRYEYYILGIRYWLEMFMFGHGVGAWPILIGYFDLRSYPHNIIIEILVELGLIGLILFTFFHVQLLKKLMKTNKIRNPISLIITTMMVFLFINALISGDLNDNRYYFAVLGLIPVCWLINNKTITVSNGRYR